MTDSATRSGWTRVAFGDVVRLSRERSSNPAEDGFERYVGLEHLDPGDLRIRRWGNTADGTTFTSVFHPGQVLFGKRRAYQRKAAVADFHGVCSGDIYVLKPKDGVLLPELLPFICQTDGFFDHAIGTSAGSLSPRTNWQSLAKYEFDLPPLEEQRRIAQLLQASAGMMDALRYLRAKLDELLEAAIDDVAQKAADSGLLHTLDDLIQKDRPITYGILKPGVGFPGGIPVIKVKDFPSGRVNEDGLLLTDPRIDQEYKRSRLREGDLLISIRGTIGRLAFVPPSLDGANITQDTARLSLREEINPEFVRTMLGSRFVQRQIQEFTTGLAVKGINIGELRQVMVPLGGRSQQAELCAEVSVLRTALANSEQRFTEAHAVHSMLLRTVGDKTE